MTDEAAQEAKPKPPDDPQDKMKQTVDWLFSGYIRQDPARELVDMAKYFAFVADRIDPPNLTLDLRADLSQCFEPVYLLLMDKLRLYPESIRQQVESIVTGNNVCEILGVAGSINTRDLRRVRLHSIFDSLARTFGFLKRGLRVPIAEDEFAYINTGNLFRIKVGINRLAGILQYASTIDLVDYDDTFYQFKEKYDPDLVDRSKLLSFINLMRVQLKEAPDDENTERVLSKLEDIETELKRSKIRWGIVITGFFILFGFLADLKSVAPGAYSAGYNTVQQILSVIHVDGMVSQKPPQLLEAHSEDSEAPADSDDDMHPPYGIPTKKDEDDLP